MVINLVYIFKKLALGFCHLLLDILFLKFVGSCSIVILCWSLGVLVLSSQRGTLGSGSCHIHCLCLALGNLLEAASDPQFVVASAGPGFTWEGRSYSPRLVFTCPRPSGCASKCPMALLVFPPAVCTDRGSGRIKRMELISLL